MHLKKLCQVRVRGIRPEDIETIPADTEMSLVGTATEKTTADLVATEIDRVIGLDGIETGLANDLAETQMIQKNPRAEINTTLGRDLVVIETLLETDQVVIEILLGRDLVDTEILMKALLALAPVAITALASQGLQETAPLLVIPVTARIAAGMTCNRESLMTRNETSV